MKLQKRSESPLFESKKPKDDADELTPSPPLNYAAPVATMYSGSQIPSKAVPDPSPIALDVAKPNLSTSRKREGKSSLKRRDTR